MAPDSDAAIHQMLGALSAKVDRLIIEQDRVADGRKVMYQSLEDIRHDLAVIKKDFADMGERIGKVEASTNEYEKIKTMGKGYLAGAAVMGAFGGGSLVLWFQDSLKAWLGMMRG